MTFKSTLAYCLGTVFPLLLGASAAHADSFIVTTTNDEFDAGASSGLGLSLREAIRDANGSAADSVILLSPGTYHLTRLGPGEDGTATGDLDVIAAANGGSLTIRPLVPDTTVTINTFDNDRVFEFFTGSVVNLERLVISGGRDVNLGGGISASGASIAIRDCTFRNNSAVLNGGAISGGSGIIERCAFADNTAGRDGGALVVTAGVTIINSTFHHNTAVGKGGAIFMFGGTLNLDQSTLSNNAAPRGGGVFNQGGHFNLFNSIVAGNNATAQIGHEAPLSIAFTGQNLISGDPQLGLLQDNGGFTPTILPQLGSPAINPSGGDTTSTLATDQRGTPRAQDGIVDIGAVEIAEPSASIEVTTNADSGAGSLREALADAAAGPAAGTQITFAPSLAGETIFLGGTELAVADHAPSLVISAEGLEGGVTVSGSDSSRVFNLGTGARVRIENLTIAGGHAPNGALESNGADGGGISNRGGLVLVNCTVTESIAGQGGDSGGAAGAPGGRGGRGGGIFNAGSLFLDRTTVSECSSGNGGGPGGPGPGAIGADADGGGIFNRADAVATIANSTISGNYSGSEGGGLFNETDGTITLANCTISGNDAGTGNGRAGGGIANDDFATMKLVHCTVSANTHTDEGGGITNRGDLTLTNTIVADNLAALHPNISETSGTRTDRGSNLITEAADLLFPLGDYGGPTQTMPPAFNGPATDSAEESFSTATDQRGVPRPQGIRSDIGAVELDRALLTRLILERGGSVFTVTNRLDSGPGSLREAVANANAATTGPGALILIPARVAKKPIALTSGQLLLDNGEVPVLIHGAEIPRGETLPVSTETKPVISGSDLSRVLEVTQNTDAFLCNLVIRDGRAGVEEYGGGIQNGGNLRLDHCVVSGNQTDKSAGGIFLPLGATLTLFETEVSGNRTNTNGVGGGIYSSEGCEVRIVNCTISENQTGGNSGGGIYDSIGSLELLNSTVSSNRTGESGHGNGAGIFTLGSLKLTNCTLSGNRAGLGGKGGGIHILSGSVTLINTTVSDNNASPGTGSGSGIFKEIDGTITLTNSIVAGNAVDDIVGSVDTSNGVNLTSGDPLLAALDNYGGPTETMPPLPGSPALDAGDVSLAPAEDQRGTPRKQGAGVEIGAVEVESGLEGMLARRGAAPPDQAMPPTETDSDELAGAAGSFTGLVTDPDGNTVGKLDLRLRASGAFSGSILYSLTRARLNLRGALLGGPPAAFDGTAGRDNLPVALRLQATDEGFRITGTLTDGAEVHTLSADRAGFGRGNPSPFAGRFTALIPADPGQSGPQGDGYALVNSSSRGGLRILGELGDGTRFSTNTTVGADGVFPIYAVVYRSRPEAGRVAGIVTFREVPNVSDFDGMLTWKKLADARDRRFPEGFDLRPTIIGSAYETQGTGTPMLPSIDPSRQRNARWNAGFGGVELPGEVEVTWDGANRVRTEVGDGERLQIRASTRNGKVSGSYANRATGTRIGFNGVAFQKQEMVAGVFKSPGESGFFSVRPLGPPRMVVTDLFTTTVVNEGDTSDLGVAGANGGIAERTFEISNPGEGGLDIAGISLDGGGRDVFAIVTGTDSVVPPGGTSRFKVRYQPTELPSDTATVTILSNDALNNPFTFTVLGGGVAGSDDGFRPPQDFWTGTSPARRFDPFTTEPIGASAFDTATHAGSYEGFVLGTGAGNPIRGLLTLRISRNSFSGRGTINGTRQVIRGSIDEDGNAAGTTRDGTAFTLALHNVTDGSDGVKLLGTFGDDNIELVRSGFSRALPTPDAGTYTVILPLNENLGAGYPGGDGYGAVTIGTTGRIRAVLTLGDGTRVTQAGVLSADGEWLFFKNVYRTGMMAGSIHFDDIPGISDFDGLLQWVKPANARDRFHPDGFRIQQTLVGAVYTAPPRGTRALATLADAVDNATVTLTGGNVNLPGSLAATWEANNRVSYTPVGAERLRFRVNARNGLVSGAFSDRGTATSVRFGGAIFQKQNLVSGNFRGNGTTGRLLTEPAP